MTDTERFFVDHDGKFLGAFVGAQPPARAREVSTAPANGRQIWTGSAWSDPAPTTAQIKAECKRRIYAAASTTTQSNLNGYLNLLNVKAATGTPLTTEEQADTVLFGRAMQWIEAMRANCATLAGDPDYRLDEKWPPLDEDIAAFAARF